MASVNRVILVGNLGADPEVRTFQNGGKIANVSIATTDRWTDKNTGEQREATEWHRVVLATALLTLSLNTCVKARPCMWKVVSKPANGKTKTGKTATPPKSEPPVCKCLALAPMADKGSKPKMVINRAMVTHHRGNNTRHSRAMVDNGAAHHHTIKQVKPHHSHHPKTALQVVFPMSSNRPTIKQDNPLLFHPKMVGKTWESGNATLWQGG